MTVTYTQEVASVRFGSFLKLLFRWRGSIYKLIWKDFVLFLILYYMLRFLYRNILNESQKRIFEEIADYANSYSTLIPFSFVLGFYLQVIFQRWQALFNCITWPDRMALAVTANVKGLDDRGRLIRRTIMRYLMVGYIMNQRSVCPRVKRRFPTLNHLTQAGLLLPEEEDIIENIPQNLVNKYVIPFLWAVNVITLARKEGRIYDDYAVYVLNKELSNYRMGLGMILRYDKVSLPLVYTQSVTFAVHMYVLFTLFGKQFLEMRQDGGEGDIDQYVHLGALLQFFLYMGWLKLAEMIINPFGDDDDDFDMNILIDRNIQYCYLVVDDLHADFPPLVKDMYWNQEQFRLPYTEALANEPRDVNTELGSADAVKVPEHKSAFVSIFEVPSQPYRRRPSRAEPKLPSTPEHPKETTAPSFDPAAASRTFKIKSYKPGKMLKLASGGLVSPKKILESVEHQFRAADESSQPFDNRFEEVGYKDPDQESKAEVEVDIEKVPQTKVEETADQAGGLLWRASASVASGAVAGVRRVVGLGYFWGQPQAKEPTPPPNLKTPEEPPTEDPPPQENPPTSWHLPA